VFLERGDWGGVDGFMIVLGECFGISNGCFSLMVVLVGAVAVEG